MTQRLLSQLRLANANFVTANLLIGGDLAYDEALAHRQLAELVSAGVTHIVDVRLEANSQRFVAATAPQIGYLHHGIADAGQRVAAAWFEHPVRFALEALEDSDAKILTHCHMGINRGPSLAFAVLLAQGWDAIDALRAIRAARPIAYVDYAGDALRWHHAESGSLDELSGDLARVDAWRSESYLDIQAVIRRIRSSEPSRFLTQ